MKRRRSEDRTALLEYHAADYAIEDSWYLARMLDFPETVRQGRTLRSARRMIRDAPRLKAAALLEQGKALPKPKPGVTNRKGQFCESIPPPNSRCRCNSTMKRQN